MNTLTDNDILILKELIQDHVDQSWWDKVDQLCQQAIYANAANKKIERLEARVADLSWTVYPDRMGK